MVNYRGSIAKRKFTVRRVSRMEKRKLGIFLAFTFIFAGCLPALAESQQESIKRMHQDRQAYRQQLSPEERDKIRNETQAAVDKVQGLTDEQKKKIMTGVQNSVDRLKDLSPEQKERLDANIKRTLDKNRDLTAEQKTQVRDALINALP